MGTIFGFGVNMNHSHLVWHCQARGWMFYFESSMLSGEASPRDELNEFIESALA